MSEAKERAQNCIALAVAMANGDRSDQAAGLEIADFAGALAADVLALTAELEAAAAREERPIENVADFANRLDALIVEAWASIDDFGEKGGHDLRLAWKNLRRASEDIRAALSETGESGEQRT